MPKLCIMAKRLMMPGPPHAHVDEFHWHQQSSVSTCQLLQWRPFWGTHAENYFSKGLLPQSSRRQSLLTAAEVSHNRVCLACCVDCSEAMWKTKLTCALHTHLTQQNGKICSPRFASICKLHYSARNLMRISWKSYSAML